MAKADIELTLKTDFEKLSSAAKKVPGLTDEQVKKVDEGLNAAQKAFSAKDWKTFQIHFNKVIDVLTKSIAATGNISDSLKKAVELKNKIEKSINSYQSKKTEIETRFEGGKVKDGRLAPGIKQELYEASGHKIISDKNNELSNWAGIEKRLDELISRLGGDWRKLSKESIDGLFSSKDEARAARDMAAQMQEYAKSSQKEYEQIGSEDQEGTLLAEDAEALKEVLAEIERLTPVSEQAAGELQELYTAIVKIQSALNAGVTNIRNEEKRESGRQRDKEALKPKDVENNTKALDKQSTSLGKAFKQFSIYAIALRTVKKAVNEATRTIKDLDKYLTTQAMVTGKTRKETYELLKTYQDMASQLGATTKEVAEVATQFMRQGKTAADAMKLTEAAISAAKVAGIGVTESVNYLTTALNGFQLSAEDAMRVSDKFASIAAQSATSYDEIATALSKVAAQANMAGMSIDYTTALLAKGIETTREAPETIGTALKTIIARMRELTDYGATLEDGMNINNVEKQLAYVGIALRTETGELHSTEDVLDELGKKWDELSSNQQAAVAKALAGTRQQSRLIAMMTDYERVTELQEIAQRSAGATAAQAATYMEGMEAALNKVNVAWEKIVTSITNNEIIINAINFVSTLLDRLGDFLASTGGMITTMTIVGTLALTALGHKMKEYRLAKEQQKVQQKISLMQAQSNVIAQKKLILEKQQTLEKYKQAMADAETEGREDDVLKYQNLIKEEEVSLQLEKEKLHVMEAQVAEQEASTNWITSMTSGLAGLLTPLIAIVALWKAMALGITKVLGLQKAQEIQQDKNNKKSLLGALFSSADSAAKIPVTGWVIAGAILAIAGVAIGVTLANITKKSESVGESLNKSSNEIYKLTEKSNGLKQIISDFEAIDNKVVKTNKDVKEMNDLLDKAADKLNEQEKADYANLVSQEARIEYLRKRQQAADKEALEKRNQQIQFLQRISRMPGFGNVLNNLLTGTNSDSLAVQSAIIANNNDAIYRYIDNMANAKEGVEYFTQSIFENMQALDAYRYATEEGRKQLEKVIDTINNAANAEGEAYANIINSEDYTLSERLDAYNQLKATLQQLGDPAAIASLEKVYSQWQQLGEKFSTVSLDLMEQYGISIDKLNDFSAALQKLGYNADESASALNHLFELIANGIGIEDAIWSVFGLQVGDDNYLKILNAYQKAAGKTILDMGQNLQAFKSQINNVYETVSKWASMSDSERTQFLTENQDLFAGNPDLYKAFETGNYDVIEAALKESKYLQKTIELRKQDLRIQIEIEKAREGTKDFNEANLKYLEEQLALLEDTENIFKADLKLRVEQENAQLDIYKTYLQKQQDALTESLEKRKDAYQKYFDTINQEAEDEDYEEQANTLITNLSKLSSSTNADAMKQSKELEKQLEQLEKERLDTLRERAQEAIMQNLEDEVSEINEKFDKLLENNQALLQMMRQDLTNPEQFVADMLSSNVNNMTALGAEQWIEETLKAAFGSKIDSSILDDITVRENGNNLVLNIAGQPVELGEASQKDLADTILRALRQLGISV